MSTCLSWCTECKTFPKPHLLRKVDHRDDRAGSFWTKRSGVADPSRALAPLGVYPRGIRESSPSTVIVAPATAQRPKSSILRRCSVPSFYYSAASLMTLTFGTDSKGPKLPVHKQEVGRSFPAIRPRIPFQSYLLATPPPFRP